MEKNISEELERMSLEERIRVIREDLTGDALLSAELVKAAMENQCEDVEKPLSRGARLSDSEKQELLDDIDHRFNEHCRRCCIPATRLSNSRSPSSNGNEAIGGQGMIF